jgi:hypothetical protein
MTHWGRFPAFRHVKNKLKAPYLTVDGYPGAVFMRWKERFLVPDHRVQDINGASFAGDSFIDLVPSVSSKSAAQAFTMFVLISTRTRTRSRRRPRAAIHRRFGRILMRRHWQTSQNP